MNLFTRGLAAAALLALPLTTATSASAVPDAVAAPMSLAESVRVLPVAAEDRTGYQRTSFRHWVDEDRDGCSTRAEVLLAESRVEPTVSGKCRVTAGEWFSYYDGATWTDPSDVDIDHMVPLAEAWVSGASGWTSQRRQAYANDLGAESSLVAVTDNVNQGKADQDPAEWMPPLADVRCTYAAEWVSTKLRWQLTADRAERDALARIAEGCGHQNVEYTVAP
ncbi:HNH endonuclease family protein [Streptomyces sp. 4R-3d]|uniref:HNH endonuclease family protein n=1 Tax=Streptomyces sp. 4R-3d TaxID=2559605 RepID=UPI001071754F|nr:HNH endonuclease family protein [Streptomyces sp. 4R-3d]TFI30123.1 HNH endonuclease [Streptomyces sp. 4R-3d]